MIQNKPCKTDQALAMTLKFARFSLAGALITATTTTGARADDSSMGFQATAMRYIGTWTGSGTYSTDFPGVAKKGESFTTTSTCKWTANRSAVLCQGSEGAEKKENGVQLIYWDPSTKELRMTLVDSGGNFDQGTGSNKGNKTIWKSSGRFADGRPARFDWTTTFSENGNTQIHAGYVTVDGARNSFSYSVKRVAR